MCRVTDFRGFKVSTHSHTEANVVRNKPRELSLVCFIAPQMSLRSCVGFFRTGVLHNLLSHSKFLFRFRFWFRCRRDQSHDNLHACIYLEPYLSPSQRLADESERGSFVFYFNHMILILLSITLFSHLFPPAAAARSLSQRVIG